MNNLFSVISSINLTLLMTTLILSMYQFGKVIKQEKKYNSIKVVIEVLIIILSAAIIILSIPLKHYVVLCIYWIIPVTSIFKLIVLSKRNSQINKALLRKKLDERTHRMLK